MSLSEMREALERGSAEEPTNDDAADDSAADANDDNGDNDNSDAQRPKSRQPPEERGAGLKESRSSIVHLEGRKGSLTYSNSVGALKRAGSSREGTAGLRKPPRRTLPSRSQSTAV
mmetsp:Transcript_28568/g.80523  ORF Transcript_28568/g.80523 Transcript_28568/m.80523 type:complete len:116 (+) Transcript_28568:859-1206(+)